MRQIALGAFLLLLPFLAKAQSTSAVLEPMDVFNMEFISDPQISPDGEQVAFVRNGKDIMTDGGTADIWLTDFDGDNMRPLLAGEHSFSNPRWSPDGSKLAYVSNKSGSNQIHLYYLDSGADVKLTNLKSSPGNMQWSPDGEWLAFTMSVEKPKAPFVQLPSPPKGADWEQRPIFIDKLKYRADGQGFTKDAFRHIFVISSEGGYARQLTSGDYNHSDYDWTPDGEHLILSANRHDDAEYEPANSELYELSLADGSIKALTEREGPDSNPVVSPNGRYVAYTGFDERYQGYQVSKLYLLDRNTGESRLLSEDLDRDVNNVQWAGGNNMVYFQYDDEGNTKIATLSTEGRVNDLTNNVGGLSLGRPYAGGTFTVAQNGRYAFTHSTPDHPADLATGQGSSVNRLTEVNADLFSHKKPGEVEEIWYESSHDGRRIQGWICKPPNFDPNKKYPLILEIHGGPFANYGSRFSMEVQLYAAAGYVVLYTNPRGSTSYGQEFGNLIHHNYPSEDYDDLMSGVDAVIDKGYIDEDHLYVTGGSGGGVLSAWIVGKTNRFRAAVVAKPVINWYSFVLHADNPAFFYRYWFPGYPWENLEHYMERSPISLVGNVQTPTMLLTGEQDYRTPMSETEQYYAALKLQKVPTAMVRIQGAGHGIAAKPSNLMNKVSYILAWFDKYK